MRQFVAENFPDSKGCLFVEGKKFHYLNSVLRLKVGDMIYVRLPDGKLQNMTLAKINAEKKQIVLQIAGDSVQKEDFHAKPSEMNLAEIWLFMFAAKPAKMEQIVRQATECGVSKIVPVIGEFCQSGAVESIKKHTLKNDERFQKIITEARQQSGSAVATSICEPLSVEKACDFWLNNNGQNDENLAVVLYEQTQETKSIFEAVLAKKNAQRIVVAVGAEGGISPKEIDFFRSAGFIPVHLKTNILRCETAALYGIATVQSAVQEEIYGS